MASLQLSQWLVSESYPTEFNLTPLNFLVWLWEIILPELSHVLPVSLPCPPPSRVKKPQDNPSDPRAFNVPFLRPPLTSGLLSIS